MSATISEQRFREYFNGCPVLHVSGKMFPVQVHYLHDVEALTSRLAPNPRSSQSHLALPPNKKGGGGEAAEEVAMNKPTKLNPELLVRLIEYIMLNGDRLLGSGGGDSSSLDSSRGQAVLVFLSGMEAIQSVARVVRAKCSRWKQPIQVSGAMHLYDFSLVCTVKEGQGAM